MLRGKIQKRKNARDLVQFCYVIGAVSEHTSLIEDDNYNMVIQGDIHFLGSLTVDGNITAKGDIKAGVKEDGSGGVSVLEHTHDYIKNKASGPNVENGDNPIKSTTEKPQ